MLRLNACPKCGGTLIASDRLKQYDAEANQYRVTHEWSCLACGYVKYTSPPLPYARENQGQRGKVAR